MGMDSAQEAGMSNDVQVIREILFGQQSQKINERFTKIEELIETITASLRQENKQLRQALEAETKAREQAIAELKRQTEAWLQQTQQDHAQELNSVREAHALDMSRLVSLLASALANYEGKGK